MSNFTTALFILFIGVNLSYAQTEGFKKANTTTFGVKGGIES